MNQQDSKYSLWLRPQQSELDKLTKLISKLSHQYRTIAFPPHITLLFGFDTGLQTLKVECEKISKAQESITINLLSIDFTEKYFMNLFILAEKNEQLMKLHNKLKKRLKHDHEEKYMPHISLLYGSLDESKQQKLQSELADCFPKMIHCDRIDIYNTTGNESQWYLEEAFFLK